MRRGVYAAASVMFVFAFLGLPAFSAEDADSEESKPLAVGDEAPDFALPKAEDAETEEAEKRPQRLSDFRGKKNVLIAFYPKADTPGCTKQLCGYRDDIQKLQSEDTEVIAVSTDRQEDSDTFRDKFAMPFTVLGNPNHTIVEAYDVPLMERGENQYSQRSVFLVDKKGMVRYVDLEYDIVKDKEPLYAAIEALNSPAQAAG